MLIDAPPPLCRDCVIAYRPGCCGWCEQVPSQYYGGVVGCYDCLAYAVEVRFVPIIRPIYGRCEYCEWSPRRYISSPTFVNVVNNNVNININIFQKTIVQPPQPKESLGADECRNIGGCGFDAPTVDEVPADEPLTPDEAAAGDPQPGDLSEDQLTDAVLDPVDDTVTAGEQEPDVPDPIEGIDGVDVDGEEEEEEGGGGEEEHNEFSETELSPLDGKLKERSPRKIASLTRVRLFSVLSMASFRFSKASARQRVLVG